MLSNIFRHTIASNLKLYQNPQSCVNRSIAQCGIWQVGYGQKRWNSNHNSDIKTPILGIRRESINLWERRAPLAPKHVKALVEDGFKVLVQPSNRRTFTMRDYEDQGAIICEDLNEASLIMGVKRPVDISLVDLIPNKTYAFFSHTIKAQADNLELLDAILERNIRLIDYEKMLNQKGKRLVAFGQYAGTAGMINILHGLGIRLLALGHNTPFLHIGLAHNYRSVEHARQAIRDAGYAIALGNMPKSMGPLTFVFTGRGNVSLGAQMIFRCLPFEMVRPEELSDIVKNGDTTKVYGCIVSRHHHYENRESGKFDVDEFEKYPERYISTFSKNIAPYASVVINGIYWAPNSPKLVGVEDAKRLLKVKHESKYIPGCPALPHPMLALCDISADPGGSIEFMTECTTIDKPFTLYDAEQNHSSENFGGPGTLVCSVDNMPAQVPREATNFFGTALFSFMKDMLMSNATTPFEEYNAGPEVKNAVIASNGKLTPNFEYIAKMRAERENLQTIHNKASFSGANKRVLVLGAGYVVSPMLEYLSRDKSNRLTVVSNLQTNLQSISNEHASVITKNIDILKDDSATERLVQDADLVVSLIPWIHHPQVAKHCIKHQKNLLTASYYTPALKEMEKELQDSGITAVMEVGLDPGIDHMLAMECFDSIREQGGEIELYESYTGGLPAPECADNALRYKFSWSPKAALSTVLNGAKYIKDNQIVEIPLGGQLMNSAHKMHEFPAFNLEGYPNRDSTKYIDLYGLNKCHTMIRGTIRYGGYTELMRNLLKLGVMNNDQNISSKNSNLTWSQFICKQLGLNESSTSEEILQKAIVSKLGGKQRYLRPLVDLGVLSNDLMPPADTPMEALGEYLAKPFSYGLNERDMIIMTHKIGVRWPNGQSETKYVNLISYGSTGVTNSGRLAMSRTVGLPTGIAAQMILNGEVAEKGVVLPLSKNIYQPILNRLRDEGIAATERSILQ